MLKKDDRSEDGLRYRLPPEDCDVRVDGGPLIASGAGISDTAISLNLGAPDQIGPGGLTGTVGRSIAI